MLFQEPYNNIIIQSPKQGARVPQDGMRQFRDTVLFLIHAMCRRREGAPQMELFFGFRGLGAIWQLVEFA